MSLQTYQMAVTTVLLIEDDEEDFILLRKVLSRIPHARYRVLWEQSFESGLAHMQLADHDICLVDYRLGASSGIELLQAARKEGYTRPIIMLTGATGGDIDIQALQAGADDYVTKELLQGELLYRMIRYAIERRKAEQERERLLREQITRDEREARRNEFISMVVHELKTPLSSLKGYAQLLSRRNKRAGDEQAAQLASKIDQQATRLAGLIEDLLDISRIEGGKLQLRKSDFNFDELVSEVIESVQLTTEQHTLIKEGTVEKIVCADRERISQILTNLLTNAIKYAPLSEHILVKISSDAQSITTCVQDSGPGIPKEQQAAIFEPFYRVERPNQKNVAGLGLGLAIAADLVKRHQGCLWVESEEGQGATFCFTLPLARHTATV